MPSTSTDPEDGSNSVLMILINVVWPAPFGPTRPTISPGAMSTLTSRRASTVVEDAVRTIGIVSGGAPEEFRQAVAEGLDAYMTGEAREHVQELTREERITFVAAGHYRTETFGVRSIGERITREFGIPCEFVDVPNPV